MKGNNVNTLFILQDSTVTCVVTVSLLEDPDLEIIHLWYMRLGHISERGLHVLNKQYMLALWPENRKTQLF